MSDAGGPREWTFYLDDMIGFAEKGQGSPQGADYERPKSSPESPGFPLFFERQLFRRSTKQVIRRAATTISFDFDASAFGALRLSPTEFAREMRIAAAVQWYAQGTVSQGKTAELAGLTRADFLDELYRRKVPACQVGPEELSDEIHGP